MVAMELWRAVTGWNERGYGTISLRFIRNIEQQEVDFLVANEGNQFLLTAAELSALSDHIKAFVQQER